MIQRDHQPIDGIALRCAAWLRAAWSGSRAKQVALLLEISEPQAKRLLAGSRPTSEQLGRLARHFGWRFIAFVMEPAAGGPAPFSDASAFADLKDRVARVEVALGDPAPASAVWRAAPAAQGRARIAAPAPDAAPAFAGEAGDEN